MDIEQYKDAYFNYLVEEMIKSLLNADKYKCIDFEILKLDLALVINRLCDNRQDFNNRVKILTLYDKKR